jgi:chromosome segregation protein
MYLKELEISGFKSFANKSKLKFDAPISAIVGPNGSGKSNIAEAFRFVLGEQSIKNMRGKRGEDLIFNGTPTASRQARASVRVTFDNSDKALPVDFEEVTVERTVFRDGVNEYKINDSSVRLKDISELLASANIGASGHHIISQGEADKILNTNPKERKSILEEALGLKIFQYKKTESEKKLTKTEENIDQVQSLRREIAPHIKFLKKQVEKIEAGKKLKLELLEFYKEYLKREELYLESKKTELDQNINEPRTRLEVIEKTINELQIAVEKAQNESGKNELSTEIQRLEGEVSGTISQKGQLMRDQGRLEGEINSLTKLLNSQKEKQTQDTVETISIQKKEIEDLNNKVSEIKNQLVGISDLESFKNLANNLINLVSVFVQSKVSSENSDNLGAQNDFYIDDLKSEIKQIQQNLENIKNDIEKVSVREAELRSKISELQSKMDENKSESLDAERKIIDLMREKNELQQTVSAHAVALDNYNRDENLFKQEITEATVLVGRSVLEYENFEINKDEVISEERERQLDRRKKLERTKIRVEEFGGGSGEEIMNEYKEVSERDEFLIKEIEDLEKSSVSLRELITELEVKIDTKFKEGMLKINKEFQTFFELMFGGGNASLNIVKTKNKKARADDTEILDESQIAQQMEQDEEESQEEGIDISISLPRKKIKGLMMLSGGERALTSIALIFAMSQVNPPPFIILDETDAALDEANSRKYGDMIVNLSKQSQLILITHNRETMGRAGVIYGVTMTGGISKLLSINFEKGIEWAK